MSKKRRTARCQVLVNVCPREIRCRRQQPQLRRLQREEQSNGSSWKHSRISCAETARFLTTVCYTSITLKKYLPYTRLLDYTYTDILELLDFFDFSPLKAKPRGEAKAELSKAKQSLAAENETRPGLGA